MKTPRSLGLWYADPLSPERAAELLALSEERENRKKRQGGNPLLSRIQRMLANFWLGGDIHDSYQMLKPSAARSAHGKALLELIYGQLLLSRRIAAGLPHLDKGFRLATPLFSAGDYLEVMNRHRLLRQLPLTDEAGMAESLEMMLTASRVIERMRQSGNSRPAYRHDPKDTYG